MFDAVGALAVGQVEVGVDNVFAMVGGSVLQAFPSFTAVIYENIDSGRIKLSFTAEIHVRAVT